MFFSPQTKGFYSTVNHGENIPADAIEISSKQYFALLEAQAAGKIIAVKNGKVIAAEPVISQAEIDEARAAFLLQNLAATDFKVLPDYQARSGKTAAEMAEILRQRKIWYQELQELSTPK